jgi:ATP-dependent protease ClpP protease subunit
MDKTPIDFSNSAFIDKTLSRVHKFYVNEINPPHEYNSWFETIRNCPETDVVVLHINSYGGDLFTAIQFMRVLNESKATIVASVEGACMSAATLLFLSANHWEISDHCMFMFHNYSSGAFGKGGEMYDNILHGRVWSEKLLRDIYKDFLTSDEITAILNNKDIWMTGEEVIARLEKKAVKTEKNKALPPVVKKLVKPAKKTAKTLKKTAKIPKKTINRRNIM